MSTARACKGCKSTTRKLSAPGPRCASCHRDVRLQRSLASKQRHVQTTYNLTPEQYDKLYRSQGGRCFFCRRATGTSKRLAVDHDHACCLGPRSCGKCVRGLLCSICNDILGHFRDDPAAFERAASYLREWPSQRIGLTKGPGNARRLVVPIV